MNWIDKHHIIRRLLLGIYSYFYLKITYHLFCNGVALDAFKVSAYVTFSGLIGYMVKFYYNSRDIGIKDQLKTKEKKGVK